MTVMLCIVMWSTLQYLPTQCSIYQFLFCNNVASAFSIYLGFAPILHDVKNAQFHCNTKYYYEKDMFVFYFSCWHQQHDGLKLFCFLRDDGDLRCKTRFLPVFLSCRMKIVSMSAPFFKFLRGNGVYEKPVRS